MDDPLIGKKLGNFIIERVLGRGGMAQVYYGRDIKLQRPVAIKVIDARYRDKPAYAQRFVKEARSVAQWRHENIIQVYYADDQDGLYYYAMEYIDGQDLASIMAGYAAEGELMPREDVLRIGRAIASALDYAHKQGVIHRDVKPSNVLVSQDGRIVLGDFGLALDMQEGSSGEAFGTPHYISPEQARRSADVVPASDIYSLGIILYEMLTGVVPFDDPSPTTVAIQHLTKPAPSPRQFNPDLSLQTENVLLKALHKTPSKRYPNATELIRALEKALAPEKSRRKPKVLPLPPMPAEIVTGQKPTILKRSEPVALEAPAAPPVAETAAPVTVKKPRRGVWLPLLFLMAVLGAFGAAYWMGFIPPAALSWANGLLATATFTPKPVTPTLPASPLPGVVAGDSPSPSPEASHTPRSTATATLLPSPTFTPSMSFTPTFTASPTETEQPSLTPSETVDPSLPTATTTPQFINYKRLWIYFDAFGLYLYNASDSNRSITAIAFERVLTGETFANRFNGMLWSDVYALLHPGRCMRIQILGNPNAYLNPPLCRNYYLATRTFEKDAKEIFWTPLQDSEEFRVLWKGQEMGRCKVGDDFCEVFIP
jgi:serine/threonine-protein kinase